MARPLDGVDNDKYKYRNRTVRCHTYICRWKWHWEAQPTTCGYECTCVRHGSSLLQRLLRYVVISDFVLLLSTKRNDIDIVIEVVHWQWPRDVRWCMMMLMQASSLRRPLAADGRSRRTATHVPPSGTCPKSWGTATGWHHEASLGTSRSIPRPIASLL